MTSAHHGGGTNCAYSLLPSTAPATSQFLPYSMPSACSCTSGCGCINRRQCSAPFEISLPAEIGPRHVRLESRRFWCNLSFLRLVHLTSPICFCLACSRSMQWNCHRTSRSSESELSRGQRNVNSRASASSETYTGSAAASTRMLQQVRVLVTQLDDACWPVNVEYSLGSKRGRVGHGQVARQN